MARINWVEIQGFRPFGKDPQKLVFTSELAVIWAANSQGKTSFAEAIEFLLTGTTCRCELTASAQDEFADSLRNAHIDDAVQVLVAASIKDSAGNDHLIRRTLIQDYGKKHQCASLLEIDGKMGASGDLSALGITLGDPPLAAPVLLQHTLGFLFSAKPQERSDYFKALLEVTDLETLRTIIADAGSSLDIVESPGLRLLRKCATLPALGSELAGVESTSDPTHQFKKIRAEVSKRILSACGVSSSGSEDEQIASLRTALSERREKSFPLSGFEIPAEPPFAAVSETDWGLIKTFLVAKESVDAETRRLAVLYAAVLNIPEIAHATSATDCPVCLTTNALTPTRIALIRASVENSHAYQLQRSTASDVLKRSKSAIQNWIIEWETWRPVALKWGSKKRRKEGFRLPRIIDLLGDQGKKLTSDWLTSVRVSLKKTKELLAKARKLEAQIPAEPDGMNVSGFDTIIKDFATLENLRVEAFTRLRNCGATGKAVQDPIRVEVDKLSKTEGWGDFIELLNQRAAVEEALADVQARRAVRKRFDQSLKEIDQTNGMVLEAKFKSLSKEIGEWWEKLRPGEATFFDSVSPRPKARRSIDFKVGIANNTDRKDAKIRDAIAIFSHSQLHCLGIAAFVARVIRDRADSGESGH